MSGINGLYADSRKAMQGTGSLIVVIPYPIVEEFGLEAGDDLPFFAEEGADKVTIMMPDKKNEVSLSFP